MDELLQGMAKITRDAGDAILEVYSREDFDVDMKSDDSPLTAADLAAHKIIVAGLQALAPEIPVLSEESGGIGWQERRQWSRYFLVDPLDGTKEFIQRNGEFTVNIALIDGHKPVLGAVYVPVTGVLYLGNVETNHATVERDGISQEMQTRPMADKELVVVGSRRHGSGTMATMMEFLQQHFNVEIESVGSSLKFCMLAEGKADLYPRLAPTSEWDTGAAQAVLEAAGGAVVNTSFAPLDYNNKEDILNPFFIAYADSQYPWQDKLQAVLAEI